MTIGMTYPMFLCLIMVQIDVSPKLGSPQIEKLPMGKLESSPEMGCISQRLLNRGKMVVNY